MRKLLSTIALVSTLAMVPLMAFAHSGQIVVGVTGMTCADCKTHLTTELEKLKNEKYTGQIDQVVVSLKDKNATVTLVKAAKLDEKQMDQLKKDIAEVIKKAGYTPHI